ncbi:MAG: VOC family protein [Ignavibacteria bacterium]|nr:VOC family protein [Ignavibacteria bacterium]
MKQCPFHYSFLVKDLESSRKFYGEILECREGRSTSTWIDFDFFGNQLSLHVSDKIPESHPCGFVDGIVVPIPHFGCIVSWKDFNKIADKLKANNIEFIIPPTIRYIDELGEQATMFFRDFSGNFLEIKSFRNPEHIFTSGLKEKK